jgi:hypothetical protein
LSISLNGGAPFTRDGTFADNLTSSVGSLTSNDGYLFCNTTFGVAIGNTVTLKAGTYTLGAASGFNPQGTQTFTGNMFISALGGNRISDIVPAGPVPEPTTLGLLFVGGIIGFIFARRKVSQV